VCLLPRIYSISLTRTFQVTRSPTANDDDEEEARVGASARVDSLERLEGSDSSAVAAADELSSATPTPAISEALVDLAPAAAGLLLSPTTFDGALSGADCSVSVLVLLVVVVLLLLLLEVEVGLLLIAAEAIAIGGIGCPFIAAACTRSMRSMSEAARPKPLRRALSLTSKGFVKSLTLSTPNSTSGS